MKLEWTIIIRNPLECLLKMFRLSLYQYALITSKNPERKKKLRGLVRQRTIPTERPQLVGEVSANFSGYSVSRGQGNEFLQPFISVF
jgi:hypothetical protein